MKVERANEACLFCNEKGITFVAKGKGVEATVCAKHLDELLKREETKHASPRSAGG